MYAAYELHAYLERHAVREPFYLRISEPCVSAEGGDFFCLVHAPVLFQDDKKIFGADGRQARELAAQFAKSLLRGRRLTDEAGRPIDAARLEM